VYAQQAGALPYSQFRIALVFFRSGTDTSRL
jgi:hypothetical protein